MAGVYCLGTYTESSCHCARLSNIILSNGITDSIYNRYLSLSLRMKTWTHPVLSRRLIHERALLRLSGRQKVTIPDFEPIIMHNSGLTPPQQSLLFLAAGDGSTVSLVWEVKSKTIGKCYVYMYFFLGRRSCEIITEEEKKHLSHEVVCIQMLDFGTSNSNFEVSKSNS